MQGDELALLRLAEDVGAPELLTVAISDAGEWRPALLALGRAPDAELVLADLVAFAARDGERRGEALVAARTIATRRPRPVEPLDPEGLRLAAEALDRLSRNHEVAQDHRALAVSALRGLVRRGSFEAAGVTTELDAP
jgi:hypothetical protein